MTQVFHVKLKAEDTMYETAEERQHLQEMMERSRSAATDHLQEIVTPDHSLSAEALLPRLEGMKVLSLATVTRRGEPRVSAVDGHFIHGAWTFGTDGRSAKARHLAHRPSVSAAYIDGERLGFFTHGIVEPLDASDAQYDGIIQHWTAHYGSSPLSWGEEIRMYRIRPRWCVAYAGE